MNCLLRVQAGLLTVKQLTAGNVQTRENTCSYIEPGVNRVLSVKKLLFVTAIVAVILFSLIASDAWWPLSKSAQASKSPAALSGKTVVIDPGHGGSDPGVISGTGIEEADLTLAIALKAKACLESLGAKVIMTRTGDYTPGSDWATPMGDLNSRVYLANSNKADAFVSIHINSFPEDAGVSGVTGFYCSGSAVSQQLSDSVASSVSDATGLNLDGTRTADYRVLVNTKMPATLLELGFMTNANDAAHLTRKSFQDTAARAIAEGIADFFGR